MFNEKNVKANTGRTKLYVKFNQKSNEFIYSGIEFAEFLQYLSEPINNILLLKGDYYGNRREHNFELIEGEEEIIKLAKENIYNYGDFCFVDYEKAINIQRADKKQIAELLYLGHMFEPFESPFFDTLQNQFAYVAHDDGWYCKLYCNNPYDFINVICRKILVSRSVDSILEPQDSIKEMLLERVKEGLLIDLEEKINVTESVCIPLYSIGEYSNMDDILNNIMMLKGKADKTYILYISQDRWSFE
jgi:hypothetical protein